MPDRDPSWEHREQRFSSLYREHYRSVQAYAVRRVESQADAADVVADVFATTWRRLSEVPDPPADLLWLYGVARRVVAGKRRSAMRMRNLIARLQATAVPASTVTGDQVTDRVLDAVATLRPVEREALALVHWEQLSHAEAAQVLGCSENAVAIRVHRARTRLRQVLGEPEPAPPDARNECLAVVSDSPQASEG
ncbi:MAG TPA: RNA polymerase sigma factor [Streptosporangiaceae bacterium]